MPKMLEFLGLILNRASGAKTIYFKYNLPNAKKKTLHKVSVRITAQLLPVKCFVVREVHYK